MADQEDKENALESGSEPVMNNFNKLLTSGSSRELAIQVIAYRILGINKKLAIKCMQELQRREQDGNDFDYKSFINEEIKNSPKSNVPKDIKSVFSYISGLNNGK